VLPGLLCAGQIKSNNNFLYSFVKPSKEKYIKHIKSNYITNEELKRMYDNPDANEINSFVYATAMDFINNDGTKETYDRYKISAYSAERIYGYKTINLFVDFLLRSNRLEEILALKTSQFGRDAHVLNYYKLTAKYLLKKKITKKDCDDAYVFREMYKITASICE